MTAVAERPGVLDAAAVTDLYVAENATLVGWLAKQVPGAGEDLAQECWIRVWRGADTYRPEHGSAKTWLYAIARNTVADHYRRAGCRPVAAGFETEIADEADVAEQVAERLDAQTDAAVLNAAIDQLPPAAAEVVRLRYLDERSVADTAAALDRPVGTVKSTCHRALKVLAELLNAPTQLDRRPAPAADPTPDTARRPDDAPTPRPAPCRTEGPVLAVRPRRRRRPVPQAQRLDRRPVIRAGPRQLLHPVTRRDRPLMFADRPLLGWLAFAALTAAVIAVAWVVTRFTPGELGRLAVAGFLTGWVLLCFGLAAIGARRAKRRRARRKRISDRKVDRRFEEIRARYEHPSNSRKEP
jgi:RNA polymerase sigma-70 factor (ECF subfamily)